jgi:hypothetical protein
MPLDPSNDVKLDHSSGTKWPICKQVCTLDSTAIYPKLGHQLLYTPMIGEIKCPRLYFCLAYSIPSPSMSIQHMHQPITNDMIHFISSRDCIGSSILTSLALHRCFDPLAPSHYSTCPSHLQPVHQAKLCIDLLHLDHMTPCHVWCAMSPFITCVSFAISLSHLHCHGICCSHTCTCELITCVSHSNTY